MSTEAGAAEGTGPPDRLPEDSTSEDTAEAVYRGRDGEHQQQAGDSHSRGDGS